MNSMSKKIDVKCKKLLDDLISLLSFRSCQMHSTAIFKASLEAYVLEAKTFRMSDMKGLKLKLPRPSKELKRAKDTRYHPWIEGGEAV